MTLSLPIAPRPDWRYPALIQIGTATVVGLKLRQGGAIVVPSACSVTVYRSGVSYATPVVTIGTTASTASVPATPSTSTPEEGWRLDWSATVSGVSYQFSQSALLVGSIPALLIDDEDLYREVPELRHSTRYPSGQTNWNPQVEEAGYAVLQRLTSDSRRPWLSVDPTDLRRWQLCEALARACGSIVSDGYFATEATRWRSEATRAAETCRVTYATTPTIRDSQGIVRYGAQGRPRW